MSSRPHHPGHLLGNGKYELVSPLGSGESGSAWLGRQLRLDRPVAIKLFGQLRDTPWNGHQRFVSGARTASLLKHPNSVRIYDYGGDAEENWLVMELVRGRDLAEVLAHESPLDPTRAIAITAQILDALAESHEYGIALRDLSPSNIMLVPAVDADGHELEHVKLLDFGFASLFAGRFDDMPQGSRSAACARMERLANDQCAATSAVAALLYEMLTGVSLRVAAGVAPRPPRSLNPNVSERLERVVLRALSGHLHTASAFRITLLLLSEARGIPCAAEPSHRTPTTPGLPRFGSLPIYRDERAASTAVYTSSGESPPVVVPSRTSPPIPGLMRVLPPRAEAPEEAPRRAPAPTRVRPTPYVQDPESKGSASPKRKHAGALLAQVGILFALFASAVGA